MRTILRRILWASALLLVASALFGVGYWSGAERSSRDPGLVVLESLTNSRPNPATEAVLLTELVTREMSLRTPGLTEWEMVNRIRDWAHANIDLSTQGYLLDRNPSFDFYRRSAAEIFAAFLADRGGVWCGGAAYSLMKLYRLFGFSASTLNYGRPEVMDHVVTLVRIVHEGQEKTVVEDPTFNLAYANIAGDPFDYFELLTALMRREHGRIVFLGGNQGKPDLLVNAREKRMPYPNRIGPAQLLPGGRKKYKSSLTIEDFERQFGSAIHGFLRSEGLPTDLRYLLLYPIKGSESSIVDEARRLTGSK